MKSMKQTPETPVAARPEFQLTMVVVYGALFLGWVSLQLAL
jgi:hypothetical protein